MNSPFFPTVVQGRLLQLLLGSAASVFFCLGLQFLLRGEPRPGFWIHGAYGGLHENFPVSFIRGRGDLSSMELNILIGSTQ